MPSHDTFDFEAPLPLPASAPRLVARVQEVAPRIGVTLSVACGRTVTVTCTGAERVSSAHLAQPGGLWAYVDSGLAGATVLVLPARLAVSLADALMGGLGAVDEDARAATSLEQRLICRHLGPALQPIVLAFAENGMTKLVVGEPQSHALPHNMGDLVALRLETTLEQSGVSGTLTLAMPARVLLPGAESGLRLKEPAPLTAAALAEVPVTLAVRLSPATLTAQDVEGLAPGDVIRLDQAESSPLVALLDEHPMFSAYAGRRGRRRAVVIADLLGGA